MLNTTTNVMTSGKSISMTATRNDISIESEKDNVILRSNRDIELNSKINNIELTAKHCVDIISDEKSVNIKSSNGKIFINANKEIKMRSTTGDLVLKSDRSELDIESYDNMNIVSEQGDITIEANCGSVNIRATNNINISPGNDGSVYVEGNLHATSVSQGRVGDNGLLVPTGTVVAYCGLSSPIGWFICDGSYYNKVTYNDLFLVIGYTFGGSSDNFRVPDMRGRLPLGISYDVDNFSDKSMGNTGGSETHTLDINEIPSHNHDVNIETAGWESSAYSVSGAPDRGYRGTNYVRSTNTGGGLPHSIMQPYIALNFIIKY
jgi:microcystin-dependent protein